MTLFVANKAIFRYNIEWILVQIYQNSKLFIVKGRSYVISNYDYLGQHWPALAMIGKTA